MFTYRDCFNFRKEDAAVIGIPVALLMEMKCNAVKRLPAQNGLLRYAE